MRTATLIGLAVLVALAVGSPAQAANWDPQNIVLDGQGLLNLTTGSLVLSCGVTMPIKATGDLATTTNGASTPTGPSFGCTSNLGVPTTVKTNAAWTATATSTSAVDLTSVNTFITVGNANATCTLNAVFVSLPNNAWNNASHTFTFAAGRTFPISRSDTFLCDAYATGSTLSISGTLNYPAATTIT